MTLTRRGILKALLAAPALRVLPKLEQRPATLAGEVSRYSEWRRLWEEKHRRLWTAMFDHMEAELWAVPDKLDMVTR